MNYFLRLIFVTTVILSCDVLGAFGNCQEACVPLVRTKGKEVNCFDLFPLEDNKQPLPYEVRVNASCPIKKEAGQKVLCCTDQEGYAKHILRDKKRDNGDAIQRLSIGAYDGEFKHHVFITTKGKGGRTCSGTIYNNRFVITAAHCVVDMSTGVPYIPGRITVTAGLTNVMKSAERQQHNYNVAEVIPHRRFNHNYIGNGNDIALLRLNRSLDYENLDIQPLKIAPTDFPLDYSRKAIITRWGKAVSGDNHIVKSFAPLQTPDRCQDLIAKNSRPYHTIFYNPHPSQFCAAGDNLGISMGEGESNGGPAICPDPNNENRPVLCGISSFKQCDYCTAPEIYTRISSFADWIERKTNRTGQESKYFVDSSVNGHVSEPEEFLVRVLGKRKECDGVLVSHNEILTAQSCYLDNNKEITVIHAKTKKQLNVIKSTEQKGYTESPRNDRVNLILRDQIRRNDIILLEVEPMPLRFFPAVPPNEYKLKDAVELSYDSKQQGIVARNYRVVPKKLCQQSYDIMKMELKEDHVCGEESYSGGSSCDRPLGSPLICEGKFLCGIASTRACSYAFPSIFANVANYVNGKDSSTAAPDDHDYD